MTDTTERSDVQRGIEIDAAADTETGGRYPFGIPYGWFQVGWSDDVAVGQVLPRYYFGRDLALWRDEQGVVHLNDAFCPHLGAHFGYGGHVDGCDLVCPFHGWKFDSDGANTDIPYGNRTNQRARLRTYPVREVDHFIMVWFHPDGEAPIFELDIPAEFDDAEYPTWINQHFSVDAAAQELNENSVDGPHFRYVHNTDTVPEIQSYETDGARARMRSVQKFPTPRGVVDGRIDVDNQGPGFSVTRFSGIVDTMLIGGAIPVDENRTEVRFSFKTRSLGDAEMTSSVGRAFVKEVCKQFEEDRPIWEHKAHIVRPALADTDPPFMKFRKWYAQFYAHGTVTGQDVWAPAPPPPGEQPVFVRSTDRTASSKYRESE
jgi:3-ketosteroid 9alpha-monooxygenase subunit A